MKQADERTIAQGGRLPGGGATSARRGAAKAVCRLATLVIATIAAGTEDATMLAEQIATATAQPVSPVAAGVAPGGVFGLHVRPVLANGKTEPLPLTVWVRSQDGRPHRIEASVEGADILGHPMPWRHRFKMEAPADGTAAEQELRIDLGGQQWGFCRVRVRLEVEGQTLTRLADVASVPPSWAGFRPDSFFASNVSTLCKGQEADLLQVLGIKVQRAHFQPPVDVPNAKWLQQPPRADGLPLNFSPQDELVAEARSRGLWVLPIVGYAFSGPGGPAKSEAARLADSHGPPRDFQEFVSTWLAILARYPEYRTIELWNEPWIYSWTWAASAADYRRLQTMFTTAVLAQDPDYRILAGSSAMFAEDNIEAYEECWRGLIHGVTNHPYGPSTQAPNYRWGDQFRHFDYGREVNARMGFSRCYLTEGGTHYQTPPSLQEPGIDPHNNLQNATKLVQFFVRFALAGGFQGNVQRNLAYGPDWTMPNAAMAFMTHMLEDRAVLADVWPVHSLITGAIFGNPRHATAEVKALPRAAELTARWAVPVPPERARDETKVAVLFALTGPDAADLDAEGTLTISDPADIEAFDISGRRIAPVGEPLTVPFGPAPVYLTTRRLGVCAFHQRLAGARISGLTPVNLYVTSLREPADRPQELLVRLENQVNVPLCGRLSVTVDDRPVGSAPFTAEPAALVEVRVPWSGVPAAATNRYFAKVIADLEAPAGSGFRPVERRQVIQVARFARRSITCDGLLDDWKDVIPVSIDAGLCCGEVDPTGRLLDPRVKHSGPQEPPEGASARMFTAYDQRHVYVALEVSEKACRCAVGEPVVLGPGRLEVPYRRGVPGGLVHPCSCGDGVQLAFGFRPRVPGRGRQMGDPHAWKGHFYDTDYVFHVHGSAEGPRVVRQWGPGPDRRNGYQTDPVEGIGAVEGAQAAIRRDEVRQTTTYEVAIPRDEMRLFDPSAGVLRFGFVLFADDGKEQCWSDAAGVFDYWRNAGSFAPTWVWRRACQTFFGIER